MDKIYVNLCIIMVFAAFTRTYGYPASTGCAAAGSPGRAKALYLQTHDSSSAASNGVIYGQMIFPAGNNNGKTSTGWVHLDNPDCNDFRKAKWDEFDMGMEFGDQSGVEGIALYNCGSDALGITKIEWMDGYELYNCYVWEFTTANNQCTGNLGRELFWLDNNGHGNCEFALWKTKNMCDDWDRIGRADFDIENEYLYWSVPTKPACGNIYYQTTGEQRVILDGSINPYDIAKLNIQDGMRITMTVYVNSFPSIGSKKGILLCGSNSEMLPAIFLSTSSWGSFFEVNIQPNRVPNPWSAKSDTLPSHLWIIIDIQFTQQSIIVTFVDETDNGLTYGSPFTLSPWTGHSIPKNVICKYGNDQYESADVEIKNVKITMIPQDDNAVIDPPDAYCNNGQKSGIKCFPPDCTQLQGSGCGSAGMHCCGSHFDANDPSCTEHGAPCWNNDPNCDYGQISGNKCFPIYCTQLGGEGCGSAGEHCCYGHFNCNTPTCEDSMAPCWINNRPSCTSSSLVNEKSIDDHDSELKLKSKQKKANYTSLIVIIGVLIGLMFVISVIFGCYYYGKVKSTEDDLKQSTEDMEPIPTEEDLESMQTNIELVSTDNKLDVNNPSST
eukprot:532704_1